MICVLINAYACAPNKGSEPGMAWNWIIHLAKHCKLYVITEGEWNDDIEKALQALPQGQNIKFYYNPLSDKIRKMCWNQGDWRFYYYYKQWQKKTFTIAQEIIKTNNIDAIHQLNMIGFREPGYLWKLDKPFFWGPVDAKETFPRAYLEGASAKQRISIAVKNILTKFQLRYSSRVKKAAHKASVVFAASSESKASFRKYYAIDAVLLNETGCKIVERSIPYNSGNVSLDMLWVGKADFRKQLSLAIKTLAKLNDIQVKLHIVGSGNVSGYKQLAQILNIEDKCIWYGVKSHAEVQMFMQKSDLLFFTSVAEGTPHVVLEAISNSLPVVCFNCCGHGDSVNDMVGVKIPLSSPQNSINDFAEQIRYLYNNKEILQEKSNNCKNRQIELSWDNKAENMVIHYNFHVQKHLKKQKNLR